MSDGYILAIDQGTTGTKVIVFDHEGLVRGLAYSEFKQYYPQAGWVEHDAEEIWSVSIGLVAEALEKAGARAHEVKAIGITNQRETTILWDRQTGEPVSNAIVWQDRRTSAYCDELRAHGYEPTIQKKTGLVVDAYFSASKIRWILDNIRVRRSAPKRVA